MESGLFDRPRFRVSGDRAILVEYGEGVDLAVNEKVRAMTELLAMHRPHGVDHVLPAYRSLALVYDPLVTTPSALQKHILEMEGDLAKVAIPAPRTVEIPVLYGGKDGPDIGFVAEHNGMTVDDVIAIHCANPYHIYTIGFAPGFCYLGGMDPRLRTPRLETPRTAVPAGSVGIAESQTGVYPLESPGGWRLIGRTPLRLFDPERAPPVLYKSGDRIKFKPVSTGEYRKLLDGGSP